LLALACLSKLINFVFIYSVLSSEPIQLPKEGPEGPYLFFTGGTYIKQKDKYSLITTLETK